MQIFVDRKTVMSPLQVQSNNLTCYLNLSWHPRLWHGGVHTIELNTCWKHLNQSYGFDAIINQCFLKLIVSTTNILQYFSNKDIIKPLNLTWLNVVLYGRLHKSSQDWCWAQNHRRYRPLIVVFGKHLILLTMEIPRLSKFLVSH